MKFHLILIPAILLGLAGCAASPDGDDPTANMTAAEIYQEAKDRLNDADYEAAIPLYERLEARFPYGKYAERAQIESAYAHYKYDQPEMAILAADRFIKLHPNHANVDYAYYLKGLASYNASESFFAKLFDQDPSERDPKAARRAFQYFSTLVKRFPKSRYVEDAIKRMTHIRNNLAKYEMHVAGYYARRGAHLAAVNRAKYVLENYQRTPPVADALGLMVTSYRELGLDDLASDSLRILELNHPKHPVTAKVKQAPN